MLSGPVVDGADPADGNDASPESSRFPRCAAELDVEAGPAVVFSAGLFLMAAMRSPRGSETGPDKAAADADDDDDDDALR